MKNLLNSRNLKFSKTRGELLAVMLYENIFTEIFLKITDPPTVVNFILSCKLFHSIGTLNAESKKDQLTTRKHQKSKIYSMLPNGTYHGLCKKFYKNGKLIKRLNYKNGIKHGLYQQFYRNGNIHKQTYYICDKRHGPYKHWNKKGKLLESKLYSQGVKHGLMEYYDNSGQLYKQVNYSLGKKHGRCLFLYHDGEFTIKYYQNDQQKVSEYDSSGTIKCQFTCSGGLFNGIYNTYSSGILKDQWCYTNDKLNGRWRTYYPSGMLEYQSYYADDILNGLSKTYYPDGVLKKQYFSINGAIEGDSTNWHPNGRLYTSVTYVRDLMHGPAQFWDISGNLLDIIYFEHGQVKEEHKNIALEFSLYLLLFLIFFIVHVTLLS